jgi:glc operon protein GlcG
MKIVSSEAPVKTRRSPRYTNRYLWILMAVSVCTAWLVWCTALQADPQPTAAGKASTDTSLVTREQIRLNLAGANEILAGAQAKALEMKLKLNIAVVDEGGHLLAFARMDGARPASAYTAMTKAATAATMRQATGPVPAGAEQPDPLLNLSLQNAAAASGGKLTTLYGGVPIVVDNQVIGAVGVGGGRGEQDAEVAKAGIASLLDALKNKQSGDKQ